jgi:hypothetical protein
MNRSVLATAIAATLAASVSFTAEAAVLEEVMVTAKKRGAFNVQDLAEAIYAVGGQQMDAMNQLDFVSIAGSVPGLQPQAIVSAPPRTIGASVRYQFQDDSRVAAGLYRFGV